jgi:hypothetical protein
MDKSNSYKIEVRAAQALAEWKALFAEQVAIHAKELSKKSGSTGIVTLEHYRLAASLAVQKLAMAVQCRDSEDDHQENA